MTQLRLLLVEDDATSAAFLQTALWGLPADVDVAGDIAQAKKLAASTHYALWLVDAHLPDGDGLDALRALRAVAQAPALAITAGAEREELDALCAGGFLEVLLKPVAMSLLLATVTRLLGMPTANSAAAITPVHFAKLPPWDNERALAAIGGNAEALEKLRRMFLLDLMQQREELGAAQERGDAVAVRALVHKLRAGCGFVGAARLGQAVESLQASPLEPLSLRDFDFAADDTMSAQR